MFGEGGAISPVERNIVWPRNCRPARQAPPDINRVGKGSETVHKTEEE